MSLKIKLIFFSATLALAILLTLSLSFYIIISKLWREQDYEMMESHAQHYATLYQDHSLDAQFIKEEHMVQILKSNGEALFIHYPKKAESQELKLLQKLDPQFLLQSKIKTIILNDEEESPSFFEKWEEKIIHFLLKHQQLVIVSFLDDDFFEIYTEKMNNGEMIILGKFSEDREEALGDLRETAGQLIIPCLLVTILLSWFMSKIFLNPILEFVQIIKRIRAGEKKLRPHISNSNNELDLLKKEFSSLMDQNDDLINSLKDTLDNVAHDLKTPLTHFRMNSELVLTKSGASLRELQEALSDGIEASDHILRLLKSLMDIQEIESGVFYLKKELINLKELIQEVLEFFSFAVEEKNIQFKLSLVDISIQADRLRLFQALANLIDNAIKYSPEHSQIFISLQSLRDNIEIRIEDQGLGISENDLPQIWDRLYRADASRSTRGAGIGLSLVKAYIMAHKGHIKAHSQLGQGSQFIIVLPIGNEDV